MMDFFSDTKTKPSRAMREAILDADVGDEQKFEDPTTASLCARVAELLGKEDAVLMASGTMCNEVALYVLCGRGDEIICERNSHIFNSECGGVAALAGGQLHLVDGQRGLFTADQLRQAIITRDRKSGTAPRPAVVSVEQTANFGGGAIWPLPQLREVTAVAREFGLATHMDGARLLNASVKAGIPAHDYAEGFDTVWIDFSKGLGCPLGAVLAGSRTLVAKARRVRQMMGGAFRQSGIVAAMYHYALDHNVARLADDHTLAEYVGNELAKISLIETILPVETNIVIFDIAPAGPTAQELVDMLKKEGVAVGAFGLRRIRVVTHLDVNMDAARQLVATMGRILNERRELAGTAR